MRFFNQINNLEELKKEYRRFCHKHHPDLGGDAETMQQLNAEYEEILNSASFRAHFASDDCKSSVDVERAMREVIEKIIILEGISLEICGTWLWITGETYPVKDRIKAAGCWFARKKCAWYWRPPEARSKNRKPMSLEKIRERHGTVGIKNDIKLSLS